MFKRQNEYLIENCILRVNVLLKNAFASLTSIMLNKHPCSLFLQSKDRYRASIKLHQY